MKTRLSIIAFMMFVLATVSAQDNSSVYDYYNSKIDEAVAMRNFSSHLCCTSRW